MKSATSMRPQSRAPRERTYSRAQQKIREEFCTAYGFAPEQIGFDGKSEDPIFDFDALAVLSAKLCNLPHVAVEFAEITPGIAMAISHGYAEMANGNTRKIFGTAVVGEPMHDGNPIQDIHQAVKVSRARALRTIHRMVGFDPVKAHREFKKSGNVLELVLPPKDQREREIAEIHMLASDLGFIKNNDSKVCRDLMATYFKGKDSSLKLSDEELAQWLGMLRAWKKAQGRQRA